VNSGELIALEAKEEDYLDAKAAFEASLQALVEAPERGNLSLRNHHHPRGRKQRRRPLLSRYAFFGLPRFGCPQGKTPD
jgi:hypothetical protein